MSRLLIVSNRLPVTARVERGELVLTRSSGGLATGLSGPHERSGGLWIGWPGEVWKLNEGQRQELDRRLRAQNIVPVALTASEIERYYDGFSNGVLWPLCHYLLDHLPLDAKGWNSYRRVNERFADAVVEHYRPGDRIWVHDYQLMLLPALLRERLPDATIGFFLHIPFPSSEVFRLLPWRDALLQGMLGASLVGFHTEAYAAHFRSSSRVVGARSDGTDLVFGERRVRTAAFPMGIDFDRFDARAREPAHPGAVSMLTVGEGQKLLVGVDRLDYTKGIPRRLLTFERLLEREPSLRGKVRLTQVCVPSREGVGAYRDFRRLVEQHVGRINGAYSTLDWVPVHYVYRSLNAAQLVALYRAADVMVVTPLRDGMNLVAKEFVACRTAEDGVLLLSEFAGASDELDGALLTNPYDIDGSAAAMKRAIEMSAEEQRERMRRLRARVRSHDVHRWVEEFLESLG